MSAQFAHVQTHSRALSANHKRKTNAWTVSDIASEARRDPEHSMHVEAPQPPVPLIGDLTNLEDELDAYLDEHKNVTAKGVERKARADAHVLISNVYSWPEHVDYYDEERLKAFIEDCIKFHEREFGSCQAAVLHLDESFPHVHAYTYDSNAKKLHPGEKAKAQAYADGADKKEANKAYRDAMSAFQERFYQEVGKRHGLDRVGPKRQRMSRKDWREQKQARLASGDRLRAVEEAAEALEAKNSDLSALTAKQEQMLNKAREASQKATDSAKKAVLTARKAKESHENTKKQNAELAEQLKKRATILKRIEERLEKWGGTWGQVKGMFGIKSKRERDLEKELKQRDQELRETRQSITKMKARDKELNKDLAWAKGDLRKLQNSSKEAREKQQKIIDDLERKKDELHYKWRMAESKVERMKQPQARKDKGLER